MDINRYKSFSIFNRDKSWVETCDFVEKNIDGLSTIQEALNKKHINDNRLSSDIVMYEIMTWYSNQPYKDKVLKNNYFKWSLIYVFVFFSFFIIGIISLILSFFEKKVHYSLLLEDVRTQHDWYKRFYTYVVKNLNDDVLRKTTMLLTMNGLFDKNFFIKKVDLWNGAVKNYKYKNILFSYKQVFKIMYLDFFYIYKLYRLSKKLNINYIYIYLRILRKLLTYTSQVENITADVLISAGDYYWSPMKYYCYNEKVDNIMLIQHNFKYGLINCIFQYCDIYFAHSDDAISKTEGSEVSKKMSIGSLQLSPFLSENVKIEYDILFINQTVNDNLTKATPNLDQDKLIKEHWRLIDNFQEYMKKNKQKRAIVIAKPGYEKKLPFSQIKEEFLNIKNIEFGSAYGPETFELIKKSKIVINMYSSAGFEAYGLNKKVLWVNYNGCCDVFQYVLDEGIHHLKDTNYDSFEERLRILFSAESNQKYKALKEKYMNIQMDPAKVIADTIESNIKKIC